MNPQNPNSSNAIHWTRIANPDGTRRPGKTWNVSCGCYHNCKWEMPDGSVATCYAEDVAQGIARSAYPDGFQHHYFHALRLAEPLRCQTSSGIFLDSMGDLMGRWVPEDQINQVLDVCRQADWHIFQLLTKNAPRLLKFNFPSNVWIGVSSPPDYLWGNQLIRHQQQKMLARSLKILRQINVPVTWMSFEPLSWDVAEIVRQFPGALKWAVIGAASNGKKKYPPAEEHLRALVNVLEGQGVPVYFKGNLKSLPWAKDNWREEFPVVGAASLTRPPVTERVGRSSAIIPVSSPRTIAESTFRRPITEVFSVESNQSPLIDGYWLSVKDGDIQSGLPPKSLMMLPQRLALALQADGWIIRVDNIWSKTNGMPRGHDDCPTKSHEYVYLLAKSANYWFDMLPLRVPVKSTTIARARGGRSANHKNVYGAPGQSTQSEHQPREADPNRPTNAMRNIRSVWDMACARFSGNHYATFPERLPEIAIQGGCPPKVCSRCGAPHERIVEKSFIPQPDVSLERGIRGANGQKPVYGDHTWKDMPRGLSRMKTIGWQPTCTCNADTQPGIVLDPFMGQAPLPSLPKNTIVAIWVAISTPNTSKWRSIVLRVP